VLPLSPFQNYLANYIYFFFLRRMSGTLTFRYIKRKKEKRHVPIKRQIDIYIYVLEEIPPLPLGRHFDKPFGKENEQLNVQYGSTTFLTLLKRKIPRFRAWTVGLTIGLNLILLSKFCEFIKLLSRSIFHQKN